MTKHVFTLVLLLLGCAEQINGQQKEPRKFFLTGDNTAFIDLSGQVVISSSQPELRADVHRVSLNLGRFRRPEAESNRITFSDFSEGLAVASWSLCPRCENPLMVSAIIDESGRMVIPPKDSFTRYGSFQEGLAQYFGRAGEEWGWGFIDRTGRIVVPPKFHDTSDFSEGLAFVRLTYESKFGYINQTGALVIPYQFAWASDFHEGLAAVALAKGKYGFIDKTGRLVLQAEGWLSIDDFSEGLAAVQVEVTDNSVYRGYKDRKYGFIDHSGKFVIPPSYSKVQKFSQGRALFFQPGKNPVYGFIDSQGQVAIKPNFVDGRSFAEGLAAVAIKAGDDKKLWGYINREGDWVIQPQFQQANSFNGGLAAINCDEYGRRCQAYIDTAGQVRWQKASDK
jgi:hypothetical protein